MNSPDSLLFNIYTALGPLNTLKVICEIICPDRFVQKLYLNFQNQHVPLILDIYNLLESKIGTSKWAPIKRRPRQIKSQLLSRNAQCDLFRV